MSVQEKIYQLNITIFKAGTIKIGQCGHKVNRKEKENERQNATNECVIFRIQAKEHVGARQA